MFEGCFNGEELQIILLCVITSETNLQLLLPLRWTADNDCRQLIGQVKDRRPVSTYQINLHFAHIDFACMTSKVCLLTGTWFTVFHVSCTTYSYLTFFIIFSDQARGVSAGGVAGGVAATAILVLCCIVFVAVYLHKRKQPAPNVHKTRYGLISHLNPGQYTRMLTISLFYSGVVQVMGQGATIVI